MIGPGQELGRALNRVPGRVQAYSLNILGSVVGIVLFAACSWWNVPPIWWFLAVVMGVGYFLVVGSSACRPIARWTLRVVQLAPLAAILVLAALTSGNYRIRGMDFGQHLWSPYYRIDYDWLRQSITVNLISHQEMVSRNNNASPSYAYTLPHILNRDAGGRPFEDVLIIGAGSGNDVSRALQWGARHVDAVEIDPVIARLGEDFTRTAPTRTPACACTWMTAAISCAPLTTSMT